MKNPRTGFLRSVCRRFQHFVGDCFGKDDDNIGISYSVLEIYGTFIENLAVRAVVLADFLITAAHSVVTADDYYAHGGLLW